MKKIIFGIFAHPDDEAFGPSGTLLKLRSEGYDIHLILLTDGDAGENIDNVTDLAATRLAEWQNSAELLGASSAHALHYPDGALETISRRKIGEKIQHIIYDILETYSEPVDYSYMTLEPNGITGHRDHIVASQITTKIAEQDEGVTVWYFCLDSTQAPLDGTEYYQPRAREDSYITTKVDVSPWLDDKYHMMDAHYSQRRDAENMKKLGSTTENFHIETY